VLVDREQHRLAGVVVRPQSVGMPAADSEAARLVHVSKRRKGQLGFARITLRRCRRG